VVVPDASPLQVVHAQAVDHHQQPAAIAAHRTRRGVDHAPVDAQRHRDRERIAGGGEVVAPDAVERGEQRLATRRRDAPRRTARGDRIDAAQHRVQPRAHGACRAPHAAVDEAGQPTGAGRSRRTERPRGSRDRGVHALDDIGDAGDGVDAEAGEAAQVGRVQDGAGGERQGGRIGQGRWRIMVDVPPCAAGRRLASPRVEGRL